MLEGSVGYPPTLIAAFAGLMFVFVAIDLYAHRQDQPVSLRDAAIWSAIWIGVSLGFWLYLRLAYGPASADLFLAGYILEETLSVDNLMVFAAIFASFKVPDGYRHRVLYWGIIGAIVLRLLFVAGGSTLYAIGPWMEYVFAAIIVWTALKMLSAGGDDGGSIEDYSDHWSVRLTRRLLPVSPRLSGHAFFVWEKRADGSVGLFVTPLFLCLICVEISDVVFAFDSVPAIIAVTRDPMLVYTAMMFAILGLRSLYFVLAALTRYLAHLSKAVIVLLFYIAAKLALNATNHITAQGIDVLGWQLVGPLTDQPWPGIEIDPTLSLAIVLGVLALGVAASLVFPPRTAAADVSPT